MLISSDLVFVYDVFLFLSVPTVDSTPLFRIHVPELLVQKAFYYSSKLVSRCIYNLAHIYIFFFFCEHLYSILKRLAGLFLNFQKQTFDLSSFLHFFIIMDICYLLALKKKQSTIYDCLWSVCVMLWSVCLQSKSCALLFCCSYGRLLSPEWSVR